MDTIRGNAYQARVDGRGIATNVFNVVSNPFSTRGSRVDRETELLMPPRETADGIVKEACYLSSNGRQVNRTTYDPRTGACKEIQVEHWYGAADGGQIRRLWSMGRTSLASVTGGTSCGPAAAIGLTHYHKSTDYFAPGLTSTRNIGSATLTVEPGSQRGYLHSSGLLWYETPGEHAADHQALIDVVPEKEAERDAWFLSQEPVEKSGRAEEFKSFARGDAPSVVLIQFDTPEGCAAGKG